MNNSVLLERLINLVMSERQAKVYLALLKNGSASSAELQKASGVPQTKIYEIVRFLASQGFCTERKAGHKRTFEAADPNVALVPNINRLETRIEELNILKSDLAEVYSKRGKTIDPYEYIEIIHGNDNIHERYLALLKTAEFELLNFTRPPFAAATKKMREEQDCHFLEFLKRGGKSMSVYEVNESSIPSMFQNIKTSTESDDDFRIAPKLPLKMFIFDRKILLIADQSSLADENELSMTVIKQKTTVEGYIALFNFIWEQASEYEDWIVGKEALMEHKLAEYEKSFA